MPAKEYIAKLKRKNLKIMFQILSDKNICYNNQNFFNSTKRFLALQKNFVTISISLDTTSENPKCLSHSLL